MPRLPLVAFVIAKHYILYIFHGACYLKQDAVPEEACRGLGEEVCW